LGQAICVRTVRSGPGISF